jgi:alpha/beta superfamily hydrolase
MTRDPMDGALPEILTSCLAFRNGLGTRREHVEHVEQVLAEAEERGDELELVWILGYFGAVSVARLAEERGEDPEQMMRTIALGLALDDDDAEGDGE